MGREMCDLQNRGIVERIFRRRLTNSPSKSVMVFALRSNDHPFGHNKSYILFERISDNGVVPRTFLSESWMAKQRTVTIGQRNGFGLETLKRQSTPI